ncbi:hypothetical protein A0J61_00605 [Choanephora cucurbitarum]|uniref:Uncharacterized protein n=1 Tax=Choanephora cucurbitarum TaxID=101091 RepID=A0A1C7NQH0_9FUNG|nr:hypothetical protein A0J61_00605 [Choanephora cucurbitarum]
MMTLKYRLAKLSRKISQSVHIYNDAVDILQLFRFTSNEMKHKATYESDELYEHRAFYRNKRFKFVDHPAFNHNTPKQLTSILIKPDRCDENKISLAQSRLASSITISSENLTAKEFADIAGITILPENEREFTSLEEDSISAINMDTLSSNNSYDLKPPQIWDSYFWSRPEDNLHRSNAQHIPSTLIGSTLAIEKEEVPRLHLAPSKSTVVIIKKGRFEICLGDNAKE